MNLYWPNMYSVKDSGDILRQSSYSASKTIEDAAKVIDFWIKEMPKDERPIISWICMTDDSDNNTIMRKIEYGAQYMNGMNYQDRQRFIDQHQMFKEVKE